MKEELVIESLMDLYREKGIDLHILLDEPMFQSLKLDDKIRLIKQYASHIASSTSRGLSRADIKTLILNTLMASGIAIGSAVMGSISYNKSAGRSLREIPLGSLLLAAGIGATVGVGKTAVDTYGHLAQRRDMGNRLDSLALSGKNSDAIKVLALRNLQSGKINTGITSSLLGESTKNIVKMAPGMAMAGSETLGYKGSYHKQYDHMDMESAYSNFKNTRMSDPEFAGLDEHAKANVFQNALHGNMDHHHGVIMGKVNSILEKMKGAI